MSRRRVRVWVLTMTVVAFTAVSAIVFAEWLATGTGEGSAAAGTAVELRVEPVASIGVDATRLVPGGTGDVEVVIFNDNPYDVEVREIAQAGLIASNQAGCDGTTGEVTYATQIGSWVVPAAGDLSVRLLDALAMGVDAADACQGAAFAVPLAVSGGSNTGGTTTTTINPPVCYSWGPYAMLSGCYLPGADMAGINFTGSVMVETTLTGADLSDTDLTSALMVFADFTDASLRGATMDRADAESAVFVGADMTDVYCTDADFYRADMSGAALVRALVLGSTFDSVILVDANLTDSNIEEGQVASPGLVWGNTTCPDGTNSSTNGTDPESCVGHTLYP